MRVDASYFVSLLVCRCLALVCLMHANRHISRMVSRTRANKMMEQNFVSNESFSSNRLPEDKIRSTVYLSSPVYVSAFFVRVRALNEPFAIKIYKSIKIIIMYCLCIGMNTTISRKPVNGPNRRKRKKKLCSRSRQQQRRQLPLLHSSLICDMKMAKNRTTLYGVVPTTMYIEEYSEW